MPVGHSVEDQTWRASWSARAPRPATSGRACPWHASSSPADTTSSGTRAAASRPPSSAPGRGTSAPTAAVDIDESDLDSSFPGRSKVKSGIPQLKFDLQSIFIDTIPDYLTDLRDVAERHVPDMIVVESAFLAAALLAEERDLAWIVYRTTPLTARSVDCAPLGFGLPPMAGPLGKLRNVVLNALVERVLARPHKRYQRRNLPVTAGIGQPMASRASVRS